MKITQIFSFNMLLRLFLVALCFLIISCDLMDEADTDCAGIHFGSAFIDDCGYCVEGTTGLIENFNKNNCGECGGPEIPIGTSCYGCGESSAVNYLVDADESLSTWDGLIQNDVSLCIYDLCSEYLIENNNSNYQCSTTSTHPYSIGDQLKCTDLEFNFSACYPSCSNSFSLSDFQDKIIWIMYEEDW